MKTTTLLPQITNVLMVNHQFASDLGLISGKMGHCILLFEYARYIKSKEYHDYAELLLTSILKQINTVYSIDFQSGLSGIAWGINYLLNHNYVEGDPNEILENIDFHIETSLTSPFDLSYKINTSYIIPHLYFLHRYDKEQWKRKNIILQNLIYELDRTLNSSTDFSPILLKSIYYFIENKNKHSSGIPQSLIDKIQDRYRHEMIIECTNLEELGNLSWQAILYHQKIKINFTEEQITDYIHNIAKNIDPEDLTMDGIFGISWGILRNIYIYES